MSVTYQCILDSGESHSYQRSTEKGKEKDFPAPNCAERRVEAVQVKYAQY